MPKDTRPPLSAKTLNLYSARDVFDKIKNHLLTQGARSELEEGGRCLYRAGNLSCAAGCLFTDEEYSEEFENNSWSGLVFQKQVMSRHSGLIGDLQAIHDDQDPSQWKVKIYALEMEMFNEK